MFRGDCMYIVKLRTVLRGLVLTLLMAAGIMILMYSARHHTVVPTFTALPWEACVLLDAGHGGDDGGAVSQNGTVEATINLAITRKTEALMGFLGVRARLTRSDESSLDYTAGAPTRTNKAADLNARLRLAQNAPQLDFVSIHMNKFGQEKYYGAQVFYSPNAPDSKTLAEYMQARLRSTLDPDNARVCKPAPDGVMLMKYIKSPAVTVECGFLSNQAEEEKLRSDLYQTKVAIAITCGYIDYLEMRN